MNNKKEYVYNGNKATVIIPDNFNGKWIWKTEFFTAFDRAEQALLEQGYARVYYQISDMYGNNKAIRLMHEFHKDLLKRFSNFCSKAILFGFSRGGLYAFNYAITYPESVEKVYLDAPVLDLKSWPRIGIFEHYEMLKMMNLDETTLAYFNENPTDNFAEYFSHKIPTLLIAGAKDSVVSYYHNAYQMIEYCKTNDIELKYIVKPECDHHPHSLDDVSPILEFVKGEN